MGLGSARPSRVWHGCAVIQLVALDANATLDDAQVLRIQSCLLELIPATGCRVRREPVVEVTVIGHFADELHPPLLRRVEDIAGFGLRVEYASD